MSRRTENLKHIVIATLALAGLLTSASHAEADTRLIPSPDGSKAIILIQSMAVGRTTDSDAPTLSAGIAGPEAQLPGGGRGKAVKSDDGVFNLECAQRGQGGAMCTLVIRRSADSRISGGAVEYVVGAERARALFEKFVPTQPGGFMFRTENGRLAIMGSETQFAVQFR